MARADRNTRSHGAVWRPASGTLVEWNWKGVCVTRPWPDPRAWFKRSEPGAAWVHTRGEVCASAWRAREAASWNIFEDPAREPHPAELARGEAWRMVPIPVREAIEAVAVDEEAWAALSLFGRCPGSLDLAASVPLLAGALSVANRLRSRPVAQPWRSARALLKVPDGMVRWRRIAAWLGLEGSRSLVNCLRRVVVGVRWGVADFEQLRAVWADPLGRKRLCHAPRVDLPMIHLLYAGIQLGEIGRVPASLLEATFVSGGWSDVSAHFSITVQAWRLLRPGRPIPQWSTPEELEADREALRVEARRIYASGGGFAEGLAFPPPPIPGTPAIRPLASPAALVDEGTAMRHCIAGQSWERKARCLLGYGYAIERGEHRATVWIARRPDSPSTFFPTELRGMGNAPPDPSLVRLVAEWLAPFSGGAPLGEPWSRPLAERPTELPTEIYALIGDEDIPF